MQEILHIDISVFQHSRCPHQMFCKLATLQTNWYDYVSRNLSNIAASVQSFTQFSLGSCHLQSWQYMYRPVMMPVPDCNFDSINFDQMNSLPSNLHRHFERVAYWRMLRWAMSVRCMHLGLLSRIRRNNIAERVSSKNICI